MQIELVQTRKEHNTIIKQLNEIILQINEKMKSSLLQAESPDPVEEVCSNFLL